MSTTALKRHELMLFALLRASLHERVPETDCFEGSDNDDWKRCYRLSANQGVMALAWDGVVRLPQELMPPKSVKLAWATGVEAYEQKYDRYCRTVDELSHFYAENGIATMQLKGVGLSTQYPIPCHREGGDIDIYTYSSDTQKMAHAEANALADELMCRQGIEVDTEYYKHSSFYYKGIPVENHKTFLSVEESPFFVRTNQVLHKYMSPVVTTLPVGQVLTPSIPFNTLFLSLHAARHYGSGLALHHLFDWAVLIRRSGLQMPAEVTDKRFLRFVGVLTMLCNRYLDVDVEIEADEGRADKVLDEMLHPRYAAEVKGQGKVGIVVYKMKRLLYNHRLANSVFRTSLIKRLWSSVIFHVRKPETILQ